ncbi:von Willebrand factor type A domain-containing protein, partial [Roseisolibacter sp. H3M3-2]|uniref:YfbK domain-containing protein n=1 Tax=Roseisolibacter sp. H3M3-2 TaxID=3031323 RepID=UPI0023DC4405
ARAAAAISGGVRDAGGSPLPDARVDVAGTPLVAVTDARGRFAIRGEALRRGSTVELVARRVGYAEARRRVALTADSVHVELTLAPAAMRLEAVVAGEASRERRADFSGKGVAGGLARGVAPAAPTFVAQSMVRASVARAAGARGGRVAYAADSAGAPHPGRRDTLRFEREGYDRIEDNPFLAVAGNPRSTFSIDVDRASYGNVRRFLAQGHRPPADAVRIEELVNYFPYALPAPRGEHPLGVTTEVMPAPWQPRHQLVRVALQARRIETAALPPSHLVFLLDVSGSMNSPDKLPLVKEAFRLLVAQLRPQDRVAVVVYAGAAGLVLPPTSGREQARILEAIDRLEAGGSTAGGEGLLLAYKTAAEMGGRGERANTRVVLATDGDFNVGVSSDAELERLIERQRASGTYLTVLGVGTGNYQDAKMEKLAKRGNGNYAYVDDLAEARKVLVQEMGATLHVVAQDVKLQVEFNPAAVRAYRLIGYENRLLRDEDFADDRKDAGDVGAGHTVTALYEVVPAGVAGTAEVRGTEPLRYGAGERPAPRANGELLFVQLRYKRPGESQSRLLTHPVRAADAARAVAAASDDFRFAASVAGFGMLLRDSEHKGAATGADVLALARGAVGADPGGHRAEFVQLVERWRRVAADVAARE